MTESLPVPRWEKGEGNSGTRGQPIREVVERRSRTSLEGSSTLSSTTIEHQKKRPLETEDEQEQEKSIESLKSPVMSLARPKTPLYRTEQKGQPSESSDCILPTVSPSSYITEATVTFGSTYLKRTVTRHFRIDNPTEEVFLLEANLRPLKELGFTLDLEDILKFHNTCHIVSLVTSPKTHLTNSCILEILPHQSVALPVIWYPTKIGKVRVSVPFRSQGSYKGFRLIIYGQVVYPPQVTKEPLLRTTLRGTLNKYTNHDGTGPTIPGGAKRPCPPTLELGLSSPDRLKRLRTFYQGKSEPRDLGWVTEPNTSFAKWINFILVPFNLKVLTTPPPHSPGHYTFKATILSIKKLTNTIVASTQYQREVNTISSLVETESIQFRSSVNFVVNIGLRRSVVKLLLYADPIWLTLLLDVVFSRTGYFGSLFEPDLLEDLCMQCLFGRIDDDSDPSDIAIRVLSKFFQSLLFLDRVCQRGVIPQCRRLFLKSSPIKSTKELLEVFYETFLKTDVMVLHLTYTQSPIYEFDLQVTELARDLRDGIRLGHLAAHLTGDPSLLSQLKLPILNHQTQLDNLCSLFHFLDNHGIVTSRLIGGPTRACDLADGDRDKTLGVIWTMILWWQLPKLIPKPFFVREISQLQLRYYRKFQSPVPDMITESSYFASPLLAGLLTWIATVTAYHELTVSNFTSSFSDGQAICYILAYYFPELLSPNEIRSPSQERPPSPKSGVLNSSWLIFSPPKRAKVDPKREAVRHNFELFKTAVAKLGGVPEFGSFRVNGVIDERIVITITAHLAHRIYRIKEEESSARLIQRWWRSKGTSALELHKEKLHTAAVLILQRTIRNHLRYLPFRHLREEFLQIGQATRKLQSTWRRFYLRYDFLELKYATIQIQSLYRGRVQRDQFLKTLGGVVSVQAHCRGYLARNEFLINLIKSRAATCLQTLFRAYQARNRLKSLKRAIATIELRRVALLECRKHHHSFTQLRWATTKIQHHYRWQLSLRHFLWERVCAAIRIQTFYRVQLARRQLQSLKLRHTSAVTLQSTFRGYQQLARYTSLRNAAITVQSRRRNLIIARQTLAEFSRLKVATLFIQARFRFVSHLYFQRLRQNLAAVQIQKWIRGYLCQSRYLNLKIAATLVQHRRRALVSGRVTRQNFVTVHKALTQVQKLCQRTLFLARQRYMLQQAALAIQTLWRGYRARSELIHRLHQHRSAICIQTAYRGFMDRKEYEWLRWAVGITQHIYRLNTITAKIKRCQQFSSHHVLFLQCRLRYVWYLRQQHHLRHTSAIKIQSLCRGFISRRQYTTLQTQHWASIQIQAQARCYLARRQYLSIRRATLTIQERRRSLVLTRTLQGHFTVTKLATLFVQRYWRLRHRGLQERENYLRLKWASLMVVYHRRQIMLTREYQTDYLTLKSATLLLQRCYRHHRAGAAIRDQFQQVRNSVIALQSRWRGVATRKMYHSLRHTATFIAQRRRQVLLTRSYHQKFIQLRQATIHLQRIYRHAQLGVATRHRFISCIHALHHLQATCRGSLTRRQFSRHYTETKLATIRIQAHWRGYQLRSKYLQLRQVTLWVIAKRRATILSRWAQCEFTTLRSTTLKLQSIYRNYYQTRLVQSHYLQMRARVIVIQSLVRRYQQRSHYRRLQTAASTIISRRRNGVATRRCQEAYHQLRATVLLVQATYRHNVAGAAIHSQYNQLKSGMIALQAQWRCFDARRKFLQLRSVATWISQARRNLLHTRECRQTFVAYQKATILIQRRYRGALATRSVREHYTHIRTGVVKLQALIRGVIVRREYHALRQAVSLVASRRRKLILSRADQLRFHTIQWATLFIQRRYRLIRWGSSTRAWYLNLRQGIISIQSTWRSFQARDQFHQLRWAAQVIIQQRRATVESRACRQRYLEITTCVITLQRIYRHNRMCATTRELYLQQRGMTIKIQACWRGVMTQRTYQSVKAATQLVISQRRLLVQSRELYYDYQELRNCTLWVQSTYRHNQYCTQVRQGYLRLREGVIVLQACLRDHWRRRERKHYSATLIQAQWRRYVIQRSFLQLRSALNTVSSTRKMVVQRRYYLMQRRAAIYLQAWVRQVWEGRAIRRQYLQHRLALLNLQDLCRSVLQARDAAATLIQSHWRCYQQVSTYQRHLARKRFLISKWHRATNVIISANVLSDHFQNYHLAVRYHRLQISWRVLEGWRESCAQRFAAIQEARRLEQQSCATIIIQRSWRAYLCRRHLAAAKLLARNIQALYRGHLVRKISHTRVRKACHRVVKANREALPHLLLSHRTSVALEILSSSRSLTQIIHACEHLVVVTQLSSTCRLRLINQYHVIHVILDLMRTCNRSQPHQEILRHAVLILENIARDPLCAWGTCITTTEVEAILLTLTTHRSLRHLLASLLVVLYHLLPHPTARDAIRSTPHSQYHLRNLLQVLTHHPRPNPPSHHPPTSPLARVRYTVGLMGLSSTDLVDPLPLLQYLLQQLESPPSP